MENNQISLLLQPLTDQRSTTMIISATIGCWIRYYFVSLISLIFYLIRSMNSHKASPWNFHNIDKAMISEEGSYKAVYYDLSEIAMGAPLGGSCFIETSDGAKIKVHDWCGGPPIWEKAGLSLAVPIWSRSFANGTFQQIAVMNMTTWQLTVFKRPFRVLDLTFFEQSLIKGCDSPIYHPENIQFNIDQEEIDCMTDKANPLKQIF